jgi:glycosyltransferase involved in cell wall biosynthesis
MRVLHVHAKGGFHGGVEQIMRDTAAGLTQRGWPQGLLALDGDIDPEFASVFETSGSSLDVLDSFRPDVLLIHKVEDAQTVTALAARVPTVRMVHDHDLVCPRRHKYFPLSQRICDKPAGIACYTHLCCVQRAPAESLIPVRISGIGDVRRGLAANSAVSGFIVGSRWMRDELEMNGIPAERISIIPPVPAALSRPVPQPPAAQPRILYVGQVIRGKGVDLLLRALARVHVPWNLDVIGTGNHLDSCRQLAGELGIADKVDFKGWVPHEKLEGHYAAASFTVVPSRWPEPFGMVGLEAMARGRAVVGFDAGGIGDWLQDGATGRLVPAADIEAMAGAIAQLLQDPNCAAEMGRAGAKLVATRFTHDAYLDAMMQALENT